jgi:hypothetical protein
MPDRHAFCQPRICEIGGFGSINKRAHVLKFRTIGQRLHSLRRRPMCAKKQPNDASLLKNVCQVPT